MLICRDKLDFFACWGKFFTLNLINTVKRNSNGTGVEIQTCAKPDSFSFPILISLW